MDLSVVIVSWNVEKLLETCLHSTYAELDRLRESTGLTSEVFVVDNASTDNTTTMVRQKFPRVRLLANSTNAGFTRANNQAIRQAIGVKICLLNPDCEVLPDALGRMLRFLDANWSVGAVGPRLLFPDGTLQSSRRRFPTLMTAFVESTVLQRWLGDSAIVRKYYMNDRSPNQAHGVDWLVGACLMIRGEAIESVGLLDERFFMYSEELDWCYRAKKAGWRIAYLPQARVIHHEGKSSEQNALKRNVYFHDSKAMFFQKHHGYAAGLSVRFFIWLTFLFQLAEESLKLALGHKRELRRQRIKMLAAVGWHQTGRLPRGC